MDDKVALWWRLSKDALLSTSQQSPRRKITIDSAEHFSIASFKFELRLLSFGPQPNEDHYGNIVGSRCDPKERQAAGV